MYKKINIKSFITRVKISTPTNSNGKHFNKTKISKSNFKNYDFKSNYSFGKFLLICFMLLLLLSYGFSNCFSNGFLLLLFYS